LTSCDHAMFPVVDTEDRDVLYGTISRNIVSTLLQQRAFGLPANTAVPLNESIVQNHIRLAPDSTFLPLIPYEVLQRVSDTNLNMKNASKSKSTKAHSPFFMIGFSCTEKCWRVEYQ
jgi:hypothetical protein